MMDVCDEALVFNTTARIKVGNVCFLQNHGSVEHLHFLKLDL